jgi:hypothetical protein
MNVRIFSTSRRGFLKGLALGAGGYALGSLLIHPKEAVGQSFVKTYQEIMAAIRPTTLDFYGAEMLTIFWETKPEIVAKLLPPPLKPANRPVAMAFVANYPRTNFDLVYKESALFLRALYKWGGGQLLPVHAGHKRYCHGQRQRGTRISKEDGGYSFQAGRPFRRRLDRAAGDPVYGGSCKTNREIQ